ncbi:unnamed protein product [Protopolystoma xenopodis]|uniref:Uncharacterized protein n=1 Tax=Protopolystoma xenopodis TaxID=117903 RepID=A0A3S5AKU0_9PLAT|nr:unnamed protein product [Protopolystoma xenopodis]
MIKTSVTQADVHPDELVNSTVTQGYHSQPHSAPSLTFSSISVIPRAAHIRLTHPATEEPCSSRFNVSPTPKCKYSKEARSKFSRPQGIYLCDGLDIGDDLDLDLADLASLDPGSSEDFDDERSMSEEEKRPSKSALAAKALHWIVYQLTAAHLPDSHLICRLHSVAGNNDARSKPGIKACPSSNAENIAEPTVLFKAVGESGVEEQMKIDPLDALPTPNALPSSAPLIRLRLLQVSAQPASIVPLGSVHHPISLGQTANVDVCESTTTSVSIRWSHCPDTNAKER